MQPECYHCYNLSLTRCDIDRQVRLSTVAESHTPPVNVAGGMSTIGIVTDEEDDVIEWECVHWGGEDLPLCYWCGNVGEDDSCPDRFNLKEPYKMCPYFTS